MSKQKQDWLEELVKKYSIPTEEKTTVCEPLGSESVYFPSKSVAAPTLLSVVQTTLAPITVSPDFSSVTTPVKVPLS